jgi:SAM-dependent methyltransferase
MMAARRQRSLVGWLQLYASLVRYSSAHNRDFAREHFAFFSDMRARVQPYAGDLRGRRILDVGCGKSAWLTLLLHSYGARVTGIDTEFVSPRRTLRKYWTLARCNGPERALRTLAWDLMYARPYYRALAALCPFPLRFDGLDTRQMSAGAIDLPAASVDIVVSHEAFEHIPDVPAAVQALRRLLQPEGVTYIYVHNFTSLSGGHHIEWKYPDTHPSRIVPPWDHLRANRFPDIPSWVNRWREAEYRRAFEAAFDILEWVPAATEGQALLTPEIRTELRDYSAAELLTKGFVIIARPKA